MDKEKTNSPSPILIVFLVLPVMGILVALLMIASERGTVVAPLFNSEELAPQSASLINFKAPQFELTDLNGDPVQLEDYQGRVLFLNFWQTSCTPCIRELPAFSEFLAEQNPDEVALLAVNFEETTDKVHQFFTENNISGVPVAMDYDSEVRLSYGVLGIPVTFVLDGKGVVRYMKLGRMTYDDMEQYLALVTEDTN
jgi:peroxiredoxin